MEQKQQIQKIIRDFFKQMTYNEEPENFKIEEEIVSFNLTTEMPQILIGRSGQMLFIVQQVLARILNKRLDKKFIIDFDVNDYKKNKISYLKEIAENIADEAVLNKKEKFLPAMTPYERRIIHLALSERSDVTTESRGEEPDRRIVIKPAIINY